MENPGTDELLAALRAGSACAAAVEAQRGLRDCVAGYPDLFAGRPFDATLYHAISLANSFGAPWETADRLRIANRTALWIFAADWLIDYTAKTRDEVDELVAGCLAVADGDPPATSLTRFLADLRDEVVAASALPEPHPIWREELEAMLRAMATEWEWKSAGLTGDGRSLPTLDEYLANASNFGSTFVNVSHWVVTSGPGVLDFIEELRTASDRVQCVLRLLNDLATYDRDVAWGDLNSLMLEGVGRAEVTERITGLVAESRALLEPLRAVCPQESRYLERQIGYSMGFYGAADYWGEL